MTNHVTTVLPKEVYKAVEALRGEMGRSTFIRQVISNDPEILEYIKRQPKI